MHADLLIVANKWWEVAPLLGVLQHSDARPKDLANASYFGGATKAAPAPRLTFACRGLQAEVWCIEDLMDPTVSASATWEKARVLHRMLRWEAPPRLVLAFGTAAAPGGKGANGNVVIGASVFVHDPYETPSHPAKHWTSPRLDTLVPSEAASVLDTLSSDFAEEVDKRLLRPPNVPAAQPSVVVGADQVAVGVVNVTNRADYDWTDQQALEKFATVADGETAGSMETTHGVIRLELDLPFLYLSGIANAVGHFGDEVLPNVYAQNFVAAHNAGVAAAWLVSELADAR